MTEKVEGLRHDEYWPMEVFQMLHPLVEFREDFPQAIWDMKCSYSTKILDRFRYANSDCSHLTFH